MAGVFIHHVGNLGKPINDFGDFTAELTLDVFKGDVGVLYSIMQQGANGGTNAQTNFLHTDHGHSQRVKDIGLAAFSPHGLVCLYCHFKGRTDQFLVSRLQFRLQCPQQRPVTADNFLLLLLLSKIIFGLSHIFFQSIH